MKTYQIIIASTLLCLGQGALASEGGDINYPSMASLSIKTRMQVVHELTIATATGRLPRGGELTDPSIHFGVSKSRTEVCEELSISQRAGSARDILNTY